MTFTQTPIIEFAIGRDENGAVRTESYPTTTDLRADSDVVSKILLLDRAGDPFASLGLSRAELIQFRDVLTMAIDAAPQINRKSRPANTTAPRPDAGLIRAELTATESRRSAVAYLNGLGLKNGELVSLARQLSVAVGSNDAKAILIQKIADATTGAREDAAAIHSPKWRV